MARSARKTTFSRHTSLWQMMDPPAKSASSSLQMPSRTGTWDDASWNERISTAIDAKASSVWAQSGNRGNGNIALDEDQPLAPVGLYVDRQRCTLKPCRRSPLKKACADFE